MTLKMHQGARIPAQVSLIIFVMISVFSLIVKCFGGKCVCLNVQFQIIWLIVANLYESVKERPLDISRVLMSSNIKYMVLFAKKCSKVVCVPSY